MKRGALLKRNISGRLLQSEVVIDEVYKHWIVYVVPGLEAAAAICLWGFALLSSVQTAFVPMLLGLGLLAHAGWQYIAARLDLFVVTNMRAFRISGIINTRIGTMPLMRILDISVVQPVLGRLVGYGHFVFESAAQEQGLKDVKFVPDPRRRDLTIQDVIQRSGLRMAAPAEESDT